MNPRFLNQESEFFDPEDINLLVRKLAAAGWLTGIAYVDWESSLIHFSAKGTDRMRKLGKLLKLFAPEFFGLSPHTPKDTNPMNFAVGAALICPELFLTPLTEREANALVSYIGAYVRRYPDGW